MNLQDERIQAACGSLALSAVAEHYPALAQQAADGDASYSDFLERCLRAEQDERRSRSQAMLTKFAGFPAIKRSTITTSSSRPAPRRRRFRRYNPWRSLSARRT